jgi:hypothetical protein
MRPLTKIIILSAGAKMQSKNEKVSTIINPSELMKKAQEDYKDPLRKNLIKPLSGEGISKIEIYRTLVNAYAFVLQFTDYESGGVMESIFGVDLLHVEGVIATFDKDNATIIFHIDEEKAADEMIIVKRAIDENILTAPLVKIYDSYAARLYFLATHYSQAYKSFKFYSAELKKLQPWTESDLPLPEIVSNQMLEKINVLVNLNETMGTEPRTPKWQEIHDKINALTEQRGPTGSNIFDEVAKRYFHLPYFPGSQLNELLTAACFIQHAIVYVGSAYDKEYLAGFLNSDFYKKRWEKYTSIETRAAINNDDSRRGQLVIDVDKNNIRQTRDYTIITKIVNWEKLKVYLSPAAIEQIPDKIKYFRRLANEIETFFIYQQKLVDKKCKNFQSRLAMNISSNDFALEYLQPSVINRAVSKFANKNAHEDIFYIEITLEATALMAYAKIKSSGQVLDLAPPKVNFLTGADPVTVEAVRKTCAKGYFNLAKIESAFEALTTPSAKLYFLVNVYVSAGLLVMKLSSQLKFIEDTTDYIQVRKAIAQITQGNAAEEKPSRLDLDLSMMKVVEIQTPNDEKKSATTVQKFPFMGLNYRHQALIKENAVAALRPDIDSREEIYRIIQKVYGFVLKFCEYESHGLVTDILEIKMPQVDVVLGTFDKDLSKIKYHPEKLQHYEDEMIIKKLLDDKAITTPLSDVYDSYENKMFCLGMIFYHTYVNYQDIQKTLQSLNPLVIYPNLPDCPKDDLARRLMNQIAGLKTSQIENGKEPSTSEWDETHKRITSTVSTLVLSTFECAPETTETTLDRYEKTFNKYFYRPYYPGSELNELLTAFCFIQETIVYLSPNVTSNITNLRERWGKNIAVKCSRGQDGQLVVKINKNNYKEVRDAGIINKLIKLGTLNKYLSKGVIEKQDNKSRYFKDVFDEIEAFITSGVCSENEKHNTLSDFVMEYLNPKIIAKIRSGSENEDKQLALHKEVCAEAAALMSYADIASNGKMRQITEFELSRAVTGKKPTNLNDVYKSFSGNYFNFSSLAELLKSVVETEDKLHVLTNIYMSAGLLILRIKSSSQHIIDTTDYSKVRENIARKAAPRSVEPSYFGLANQLISTSLSDLLENRILQNDKNENRSHQNNTKEDRIHQNNTTLSEMRNSEVKSVHTQRPMSKKSSVKLARATDLIASAQKIIAANELVNSKKTLIANKYLHQLHFAGSHLFELHTAVCFIQETIYMVAMSFNEDILKDTAKKYQEYWNRYTAIKASLDHGPTIEQYVRLIVQIDETDLHQVRDAAVIKKLVKLNNLNHDLSPAVVEAQENKGIYLKMLFDEVETFAHNSRLQDINIHTAIDPAIRSNPDLDCIFSSDFALEYAAPANILTAAKAFSNDEEAKLIFYKTFCIEAGALMSYADIHSNGRMRELTQFEIDPSLKVGETPKTLDEVSVCFINGYLNFGKIDATYKALKTFKEQMLFLTNLYICAGILILRINSPKNLIVDRTKYESLRETIDRIKAQTPMEKALGLMEKTLQEATLVTRPAPIEDGRIKQNIIKKYFNPGNIDVSDFLKGLCFIQAAFNVATNNYFLDTEYKDRSQIIQRRWKKHLSVQPKNSIDPNTAQRSGIGFEYDKQKPQQSAEAAKLTTLLNLDKINSQISLQAAYVDNTAQPFTQVNQTIKKLFAEIEDYLVEELQKTPYRHFSPHLDIVYISEFAKTKLRHMAVEELAAMYSETDDITNLMNDISVGINSFMKYCDCLTQGLLPRITGVDYRISITDQAASKVVGIRLVKLREDANFYVDLNKFEKELTEMDSYKARLEFLATEYIQAYSIDNKMSKSSKNAYVVNLQKFDVNKIKLEINGIIKGMIKAYETPTDEKSVQPVKLKQKSKKQTTSADRKNQEPVENKGSIDNTPPSNPKLQAFKIDYNTTESQSKILNLKIETLLDELKDLVKQLQQTFALDNKERQYDLRPHKKRVNDLVNETCTKIGLLDAQLQKILGEMKPDDEAKLEENQTILDDFKIKISVLEAHQEKLLAEIREEAVILDHIIPKKTLKKAEATYQEAQRKKERLAREKEEEIQRSKRIKVEKPKIKPSSKPVPALTSPTKKPAAHIFKSEHKSSKPDPQASLRLLHLNEACINLVFIQKLLTIHKNELSADVTHYALLYNIFRCFQSLKMYQQKGGQQRSINPDEVANLRNMIIHHGASSAHPEAVEAFAEDIKAKLPQQLLKLTNRSLSGYELPPEQRQQLMAEFNLLEPALRYSGFVDHSSLVLDNTELYKKLAAFHEQKTNNNDSASILESILGTYIPLIKSIIPPLAKATSSGCEMKPEHFFDTFYFHLQALRMLATICGEFEAHFNQLHTDKNFQTFLQFCRTNVRNIVAHEPRDFIESLDFFRQLNFQVSKVDDKRILDKIKPKKANPAAFFTSGSAMDAKYDKKPGPRPGKGLN